MKFIVPWKANIVTIQLKVFLSVMWFISGVSLEWKDFSFVQVLFDSVTTLYADILEDTKHWSNCLHSVFTNQVRDSMNPFVQFTTAILWQLVFFATSITTVKVILYLAFAKN